MKLFNQVRKYGPRVLLVSGAMAFGVANAAVTIDPDLAAKIGDAIAYILLVVALGGAGFLTIAAAGVGWNVGAKFIKRLGSKA